MGCILEVDMSYPESLHDERAHMNYPLAVGRLGIDSSMWSEYQKETFPKRTGKSIKLTPNL